MKSFNDKNLLDGFKNIPYGTYEVKIMKLELNVSSEGDPMVNAWFKILSGEFENSLLFMKQVITQGCHVSIVNDLLRAIDCEIVKSTAAAFDAVDIEAGKKPHGRLFESYVQYGQLLMDVYEEVKNKQFEIEYREENGFNTFKIAGGYI